MQQRAMMGLSPPPYLNDVAIDCDQFLIVFEETRMEFSVQGAMAREEHICMYICFG